MSFAERYLNRHILFEIAPGAVFFAVNAGFGLRWASSAVIVASIVCCALITRFTAPSFWQSLNY